MASEDSDDEPLSVIAALKQKEYSELEILPVFEGEKPPKKKKKLLKKPCDVTIELQPGYKELVSPAVVERPADVWMYLKDLKSSGPYSCLLCSEWFINKTRIVIHYVINHKKDYCGICRYFVPSREAWWNHLKFHTPWQCSQCTEKCFTQADLRKHFSDAHKLVHCRLCHFRLPHDDQYDIHLFQKHGVTNVANKYEEFFWDFEYEGSQKFLCLLCSKSNSVSRSFSDHYMAYHHFTLKCFASLISGADLPLHVKGIDLTPEFINDQLKGGSYGYVELDQMSREDKKETKTENTIDANSLTVNCMPEIKEEACSEVEESPLNGDNHEEKKLNDAVKAYKGDEDFDVTLMELIMMQQCYFDYVNETLNEINSNVMPKSSYIKYGLNSVDALKEIDCSLCKDKYNTTKLFATHMVKMHCVKSVPTFSCRVCATVFDSQYEFDSHSKQELGDFEDLWLCQFCDKEFDDRESTRNHLTEHWSLIEYDNCFSPHLGFKCKFCPTLFWNETDRETHQVRVHFQKHKSDFYRCVSCDELFSDKVWYIYHYLEKHRQEPEPAFLVKCCICCVVLSNVEEMRSHFVTLHPEAKKIFCSMDDCKYKPYSHKKSFQLHLRAMHNPATRNPRSVNCTTCGQEFDSLRACSAHATQAHGPGKYKCTICHEVLQTSDERKIHYLIRHPGRYQFQCDECDKSFQYKSSLYLHKQEHSPNKQNYTCSYCGKVFKKRDSYREHVQIHEAPRHACSYCPMRFVQRSNMLRHERRHTGERPYVCPHCPRTFSDKGACTSHARTHQKEPSFVCVYCGQTFAQKSKLTYHIRKHTGENLETCSVCSKMFTSACSLREHMKTHQKSLIVKNVKCPLCDKKFQDDKFMMRHMRAAHTGARFTCPLCRRRATTASALREHVLTHSKRKHFRCQVCPKAYNVKRTMVRHLRRRHGIKPPEANTRDYYTHLEPRDCEIGLDEETMTNIFGPPRKKRVTDLLMGDFVTFNKKIKLNVQQNAPETQDKSKETAESEEDASEAEPVQEVRIKLEPVCEDEDDFVPTDFVNVKVEFELEDRSNADMEQTE